MPLPAAATTLRISEIEPRSDQPRKTFEHEPLEASGRFHRAIRRDSADCRAGQTKTTEGTYEILAGERRWRAAKMAGLSEIPAVILDGDDLKAAQVSVIENVQREDLNPIEEALAYQHAAGRISPDAGGSLQAGRQKQTLQLQTCSALLDLPDEVLELGQRRENCPPDTRGHCLG